jgi:hypothetical protein
MESMGPFVPSDGQPILNCFAGTYPAAFIALHPFFAIDGLDPASCNYGSMILDGRDRPDGLGLLEWADLAGEKRRSGTELGLISVRHAAKRFGEAIRWSSVLRHVGLADHRALDRALRTHIGGLKATLSDPDGALGGQRARARPKAASIGLRPPAQDRAAGSPR